MNDNKEGIVMSEHHHHVHANDISAREELQALLAYMVRHNASHAEELSALAEKPDLADNPEARKLILSAIEEYQKGNALLSDALALLSR